jgi:HEAT repeat protein
MNENSDPFEGQPTLELVNIVLTSGDEDYDDSTYWNAIWTLRRRPTPEVFEAARSLCESSCSLAQRIGCDILAQLGAAERPFASVSFPLVASVVANTDDLETLTSALSALGWLGDLRGVDLILPYLEHPDSDVRYSIRQALAALHADQRSINGLIRLTTDSSVEIRDWATFGLGSLTEQDTPAIREALLARLDDPDAAVRGEALVGLAIRQEQRVVEPLREALEEADENHSHDFAREALDELHDIEKYPQLLKWKAHD